jgi:hypothetical protein
LVLGERSIIIKMSTDVFASFTKGVGSFLGKVQKGVEQKQSELKEAKEAKEAGKVWDKTQQQWVFYFLDEEWEELLEKEKTMATKRPGSTVSESGGEDERPVKDRTVRWGERSCYADGVPAMWGGLFCDRPSSSPD